MLSRKGIVQAVAKGRIEDFPGTHPVTPPPGFEQIRPLVHILHTTGNHAICFAKTNLACGHDNGFCPRSADTVHGRRRHALRHSAMQRRLSCRIHPGACLDNLAKESPIDKVTGQIATSK